MTTISAQTPDGPLLPSAAPAGGLVFVSGQASVSCLTGAITLEIDVTAYGPRTPIR